MLKKVCVIAVFALIGWGICGAIINIGRGTIGTDATLIVHAIAVPIVFGALSFLYHRYFHYTRPRSKSARNCGHSPSASPTKITSACCWASSGSRVTCGPPITTGMPRCRNRSAIV